jgi:hypothetical protein
MGLADRDYMRSDRRTSQPPRDSGVPWLARLRFAIWVWWRKLLGRR